jgi:DNA-binding transcriptional LysR family regulator
VITERSVSKAAVRLGSTQPAVSAQLRRLRELTQDPLLVRAGQAMVPTERAKQLAGPAEALLAEAQRLFAPPERALRFDPRSTQATVRLAASDYLDPLFLPEVVTRLRGAAPQLSVEIRTLSADFDYRRHLAQGDVDLVVGNWPEPPAELHLARLLRDEVVCLVSESHPAVRLAGTRAWNAERYLACDHVAPAAFHPGAVGVIDQLLAEQGLRRHVVVHASHFSLIPLMVARGLLVLTTGRLFCSRYLGPWPLKVLRCPVDLPPLDYYQLWHDVTHRSPLHRWLREQVRTVAASLRETPLAGATR